MFLCITVAGADGIVSDSFGGLLAIIGEKVFDFREISLFVTQDIVHVVIIVIILNQIINFTQNKFIITTSLCFSIDF